MYLEHGWGSQEGNLDKNEYFYIALSQTCKNINEREVNDCIHGGYCFIFFFIILMAMKAKKVYTHIHLMK